ncbi:MAG TPA: DUF2948 family protein [Rhizomicrobium sp.]|nr:DUF2948 family protein [Rhizomicrobium sp.]
MSRAGTSRLKLAAADVEDLQVLSARLQDAVLKLGNVSWQPKKRRFAAVVNRLQWETGGRTRVRAGLHFGGVLKAQSQNVKLGARDAVVSLLAVRFTPDKPEEGGGEDPGGVIELVLAGGGAFRLMVECIDAELSDMTSAWAARRRPDHEGPARKTPNHQSEKA